MRLRQTRARFKLEMVVAEEKEKTHFKAKGAAHCTQGTQIPAPLNPRTPLPAKLLHSGQKSTKTNSAQSHARSRARLRSSGKLAHRIHFSPTLEPSWHACLATFIPRVVRRVYSVPVFSGWCPSTFELPLPPRPSRSRSRSVCAAL